MHEFNCDKTVVIAYNLTIQWYEYDAVTINWLRKWQRTFHAGPALVNWRPCSSGVLLKNIDGYTLETRREDRGAKAPRGWGSWGAPPPQPTSGSEGASWAPQWGPPTHSRHISGPQKPSSGNSSLRRLGIVKCEKLLIFTEFFRVQKGGPLKSAALFGRTLRTCLRPALVSRTRCTPN